MKKFQKIAMIARWKPVHLGHLPVLFGLADSGHVALIGVGSANRYNARNPFTFEETRDMIELVASDRDNLTVHPVPDLDDGPRWRSMVHEMFGELDCFFTDNPYVSSLMDKIYQVEKPVSLVSESDRIRMNGTMVRQAMAKGDNWRRMVPSPVADYIQSHGLDRRFRREFGLETLAMAAIIQ